MMHPVHDLEQDKDFVKKLYKLKGFAYLRSGGAPVKEEQSQFESNHLVKSAMAFELALKDDKSIAEEVDRIRSKQKQTKRQEEVL